MFNIFRKNFTYESVIDGMVLSMEEGIKLLGEKDGYSMDNLEKYKSICNVFNSFTSICLVLNIDSMHDNEKREKILWFFAGAFLQLSDSYDLEELDVANLLVFPTFLGMGFPRKEVNGMIPNYTKYSDKDKLISEINHLGSLAMINYSGNLNHGLELQDSWNPSFKLTKILDNNEKIIDKALINKSEKNDITKKIKQVNELRKSRLITEEEFKSKKKELLDRI